jgi:hypothetical protein
MTVLTSEEDLQTALGISAEANGGVGLFSNDLFGFGRSISGSK